MAEILARGWNVAVPEVDMGDDIFVAQDDGSRLTRVQVKTSAAEQSIGGAWTSKTIKLPSAQFFREGEEVPLTYVFALRTDDRWEFVVVSRERLQDEWFQSERDRLRATAVGRPVRGRPRKNPDQRPDPVALVVILSARDTTVWGRNLHSYRNNWEAFELLMLPSGEGATPSDRSTILAVRPRPAPTDAGDRDPSGGE